MGTKLLCQSYSLEHAVDSLVKLSVQFVVFGQVTTEATAAIQRYIRSLENGEVELVMAAGQGKMRCFYCGVTNDQERHLCTQCGAPL